MDLISRPLENLTELEQPGLCTKREIILKCDPNVLVFQDLVESLPT